MSLKFDRLVSLLRELFQLDQPDLDFGLYRIMHAKAAEVTQFLEKDLLPQVRKAFEQYQPADKAAVQKRLAEAIAAAESLGVDPNTNPKVAAIKAELAAAVDLSALEDEVFDHLHSFFRRYYSEGDFLSKRVYKPGVYAVPYEGEEVMLHWANKDQYYIKTSEYLRDYAFRLKPDSDNNPMRVHFRLAEVAEGEHGNIKAAEGKDRVFILAPAGESGRDFIEIEKVNGQNELVIKFAYRPATMEDWTEDAARSATEAAAKKPPTQKVLSELAIKAILAVRDTAFTSWIAELAKPHVKIGGEQADYSRLQGHLSRYTGRHTFDYFIHKELGVFLRRELDFYIKNEVMHLDDIESESAAKVEQYLSKIKVLRRLAGKIIAFVSQLEDFQRRAWLKKKFVVESFWCVPLAVIPTSHYPAIAESSAQVAEWVALFAIDQIKGDLTTPGYSSPLAPTFLSAHPSLVVDSRRLAPHLAAQIAESLGDLLAKPDFTLFHADNFHALSLMRRRYERSLDCVFADPPYNTGLGDFLYRDSLRHSSWMTMIENRYSLAATLLRSDGSCWTTLDNNEANNFQKVADSIFGADHFVDTVGWKDVIGWQKVYSPRMDATQFSSSIDFLFVFSGQPNWTPKHLKINPNIEQFPHIDAQGKRYRSDPLRKWGKNSLRTDRQNLWFPIRSPDGVDVWPIKPDGTEGCWRWQESTVKDRYAQLDWLDKGNGLQPYVRQYAENSDWRPVETLWSYDEVGSTHEAAEELKAIMPGHRFQTVKPTRLIERVCLASGDEYLIMLDFFAGTGTTGHALVNLNRRDAGRRSGVLVEMGDHFESLLLPRLKRVAFAPEWNDGKPVRLPNKQEVERSPRLIRALRLESYEDSLNNLLLKRSTEQDSLLGRPESKAFAEQYTLRYMLDTETRGSSSLLNIRQFTDPTAYTMRIKRPGTDESVVTAVDLIETFNWLIGLSVSHFAAPQTFTATFERDSEGRLRLKGTGARGGRLKPDANGKWWFRTVTGKAPDGQRVLVIWRKRPGGDTPEGIEQDNLVLDEWFRKQGYSSSDAEFDLIYVNGDNNLGNLRQEEADEKGLTETGWKVRVIEEDFHRLMFDTEGT